jgi:hypothetical protein
VHTVAGRPSAGHLKCFNFQQHAWCRHTLRM